ncbi:MAG: TerB family tellurite resistance protein [Planctomycetes bacterium]|nr:TerB family tellurite resistance protein [Planctomycetota bacterium]
MADWKKLAKSLILADGYIEEKETDIIRKELLADGVINKSEAEFLIDLRNSAPKAVAKFHTFVFEVVKKAILADGDISASEAAWITKFILADGKVDDMEKAFLKDLKASAKKTCPEFEELIKKYAA